MRASARWRQPSRHLGLAAVVLVTVLVLAQTLGLMHRSWQGAGHGHSPMQASTASADGFGVGALFDHTDGTTDCRLYDAASQPGCPPTASLALARPLPAGPVLARQHGEFVARWASVFDARGPPLAH